MRFDRIARMALVLGIGLASTACATSSSEIRGSYVSPLQFSAFNCQQITSEMERISRRASELAGVQDGKRTTDALVTAGAIVLFWPAAFFIQGDGQTAAELARLKGEFEALEKTSLEKNCQVQIQRSPART